MISEQEINKGMMVLKIIWSAILVSLAVYLVVGRMIAPGLPPVMDSGSFAMLRLALYALGFATLVASRHVKKLVLARPAPAMQRYTSAVIVSLAMCESIGIFGLVLFIIGRDPADFYLLLGVSAAAVVYYRPRKEELAGLDAGN